MAFLDKLGEVAKSMTEKAGDSMELNKLNGEISIEKGNIQCFHRELGEHYWAKFVMGEKLDDEAMLICDKVVLSQDRIRSLEEQMELVKVERMEKNEARRLAKEEEAKRIAEEEEAKRVACEAEAEKVEVVEVLAEAGEEDSVKFCGNCGGAVKEDKNFCIFCGKPL